MHSRLMERFGSWLGVWRGPAELEDGRKGIAEFRLSPYFEGQLIEVEGLSIDAESGESQSWGIAHVVLDASGRAVWRQFNRRIGFCTLHESPDDPEVLTVRGALPGGREMVVNWQVQGDELFLTVAALEASGNEPGRRTTSRMCRVGSGYGERLK